MVTTQKQRLDVIEIAFTNGGSPRVILLQRPNPPEFQLPLSTFLCRFPDI